MYRFSKSFVKDGQKRIFDWLIRSALNLHRRGETRPDGLRLKNEATCKLNLELWARDIHPWDREGSVEKRRSQFVMQALTDTGDALARIFDRLPQVEEVALQVFEQDSRSLIMAGDVQRSGLKAPRPYSDKMWLNQLGVRFRIIDDRFEPLCRQDIQGTTLIHDLGSIQTL